MPDDHQQFKADYKAFKNRMLKGTLLLIFRSISLFVVGIILSVVGFSIHIVLGLLLMVIAFVAPVVDGVRFMRRFKGAGDELEGLNNRRLALKKAR